MQAGDTHRDAHYYDVLVKHAFGSYRDLLVEVTHSPGMGLWLTYTSSRKANGVYAPDENYAREIMQLFTIGLDELNIDGTAKLDAAGDTIASYEQLDVEELARVFTGWNVRGNKFGKISAAASDYTRPMSFYSDYHDFGAKTLLGATIPAGLTGDEDIEAAIDILMAQPSMAPFVSKQLIKRLVTSNPSPAYVARVAQVFKDTTGNLKEVTRAILLDDEARASYAEASHFGKVKEPVLAFTELLRHLHVSYYPYPFINSKGEAINFYSFGIDFNAAFGQTPLASPTVFNFYSPDYTPNDPSFRDQGLVSPELEIISPQSVTHFANATFNILARNHEGYLLPDVPHFKPENYLLISYRDELKVIKAALDGDYAKITDVTYKTKAVDKLMAYMNQKFTSGELSDAQMFTIKTKAKGVNYNADISGARRMVSEILRLVLASNTYMVQR